MNTPATPAKFSFLRRWLPRFSLRTFLLAMGVLSVGLGCVGIYWQRLRHQRAVVAKLTAAGGDVRYNYQFGAGSDIDVDLSVDFRSTSLKELPDGRQQRTRVTSSETIVEIETPPGPKFVRLMLGDDAFAHVESVSFFWNSQSPEKLDPQLLLELPELKHVLLVDHQVSDEWVRSVAQVPRIRNAILLGDTQGTATGEGLARLRSARQLQSLGLSGEWLHDKTINGIAGLRQLKSLQLSSVPNVTSAIYPNLHELTDLRELFVFRAKNIDDEGSDVLRRLTQLHKLTLGETSISDKSLEHLRDLTLLEMVDVAWTNVGDAGMEHLAALPNLKRVNVGGTQVGDAGLAALSHLPQLQYLTAGRNASDAGMPHVARMTQLETLDLYPSAVTDAGLMQLQSLKNLKRLSIGPHVTAEAANALRAALPGCDVVRLDKNGRGSFPE